MDDQYHVSFKKLLRDISAVHADKPDMEELDLHYDIGREQRRLLVIHGSDVDYEGEWEALQKLKDKQQSLQAFEKSGAPEDFKQKLRSNELQQTKSLLVAQHFLRLDARDKRLMALCGNTGAGKSFAAAWWLKNEVAGVKIWIDCFDLERLPRNDPRIDVLFSCRALVIDDLGTESVDERERFLSLFDSIMRRRHANFLKTVITSNGSMNDLISRYGERFADRLKDAVISTDSGPSLRGAKTL